jgi:hypothetical protein
VRFGAITHRLCRLIWKILHERVRYEERGLVVSVEAKKVRARKTIREFRSLASNASRCAPDRQTDDLTGPRAFSTFALGNNLGTPFGRQAVDQERD